MISRVILLDRPPDRNRLHNRFYRLCNLTLLQDAIYLHQEQQFILIGSRLYMAK